MFFKATISFVLLFPLAAFAWDDAEVLAFIKSTNPVIKSQQQVSDAYAVPNA